MFILCINKLVSAPMYAWKMYVCIDLEMYVWKDGCKGKCMYE